MKKNKNINWIDGTFTIGELIKQNDHIIPITLRVRLKKMIENGEVTELGTLPTKMGRPQMLLTKNKVTDDILSEAKSKDIVFNEKFGEYNFESSVDINSCDNSDESEEEVSEIGNRTVILEHNLD